MRDGKPREAEIEDGIEDGEKKEKRE